MKKLLKVLGNWWVVSVAVAVVCGLLLALILPMIVHPLRPWPWRLTLLLAVAVVWGLAALGRVLLSRRASSRLAAELETPGPSSAANEQSVLDSRMKEAMTRLKAETGGRRGYLYSRPWYVIIGAPGAGKTTALLNSGLRFPYSDAALKGIGGTRNLDFWFADQAVLVDTAGRYTSQDSDQDRDRAGWTRFLSLLRQNRPLRPINGILVAVSLDSFENADCAAIDRQADTIRLRLKELRDGLESLAPVYVIFTKSDLLAGFREYHDDLDAEGRRAVLGATLPLNGRRDAAAVAAAFDEVAHAVADRVSGRIQAERDLRRRGLIIGFPAQVDALRDGVVRLLTGIFPADSAEAAGALRGFYFTSGVQEGTPFDAVLSATASLADSQPEAAGRGRAYFINRLLTEVVLGEAGLARATPEARRRRSTITTAAFASIGAVSACLLIAWLASFLTSLNYQDRVLAAAGEIQPSLHGLDLRQVSDADPSLAAVTPVLDQLRQLPGGYADRRAKRFPGFPMGLGLADDGLSRDVEAAYQLGLQRILMPRVLLRMEGFLRENRETPIELYSALRAYRLISGDAPPKIQKRDVASIADWVEGDWTRTSLSGGDLVQTRAALRQHLDALLADPDMLSVWGGGRKAPYDPSLVESTQSLLLSQLTDGQRGYAILRDLGARGEKDWTPGLPDEKYRAFASPDRVKALRVPFLFTRQGYVTAYPARLKAVIDQLSSEGWVLDNQAAVPLSARVALANEISEAYAAEYSRRWREVLATLAPGDYVGNDGAAQALFAPPSPLATMIAKVRKETSLTIPGKKGPNLGGLDAGGRITADFASLGQFDVNAFVTLIKRVKEASILARTDPTAAASLQKASAELQVMALNTSSPELGPLVAVAAGKVGDAGRSLSADALQQEYLQTILPVCQRVTSQAFPFVRTATGDASRGEVSEFFRPGGLLDAFIKNKLSQHIDPIGPYWRWKADDPVAQLFKSSPQRFQEARDLQILMSEGLQMQLTPVDFSPDVQAVEVRIGNATETFRRGDNRPIPFRWRQEDNATAMVSFQGTPDYLAGSGEWAIFRLFGPPTQLTNTGNSFMATFAKGSSSVTFRVLLSGNGKNPFRDGPWGFRCPASL